MSHGHFVSDIRSQAEDFRFLFAKRCNIKSKSIFQELLSKNNLPFCMTVDWFCYLLWYSKLAKTTKTETTRTSQ